MTKLTISITDEVARGLMAEAHLRNLSVEQVAAERIGASVESGDRKATPARPPLRRDNPESVIGSFADRPALLDNVDQIIDDRARRYSGPA